MFVDLLLALDCLALEGEENWKTNVILRPWNERVRKLKLDVPIVIDVWFPLGARRLGV